MDLLRHLEAQARERLSTDVYDYFAGGAGDEQTVAENAQAWRRHWIRPRVMVDVAHVDTTVDLLGRALTSPLMLAPVAAQRLLHPDGELAAARAASAAGLSYVLSTRATTDLALVAEAAPAQWFFQLYVSGDRDHSAAVLARAAEHGASGIVLTVDMPVPGRRERELRHADVPMPDGIAIASHLGWDVTTETKPVGGWDASLTWADVAWIQDCTKGLPVLVKGVLRADDALAAVEAGAAGVIVSNHGGRQLDGCVPTAVALPEVVAAVDGRVPVLVDGGLRDGADVFRALALGASAVLMGRPFAWGLAADGERGVLAVLQAFTDDLERTMALAGCRSIAEITPDRVVSRPW